MINWKAGGVSPFDGIGKVAGATDLTCAAAVAAVAALTAKLPGSFPASSQLNYIRPLAQSTKRGTVCLPSLAFSQPVASTPSSSARASVSR